MFNDTSLTVAEVSGRINTFLANTSQILAQQLNNIQAAIEANTVTGAARDYANAALRVVNTFAATVGTAAGNAAGSLVKAGAQGAAGALGSGPGSWVLPVTLGLVGLYAAVKMSR